VIILFYLIITYRFEILCEHFYLIITKQFETLCEQALALLDAGAGEGGALWPAYVETLLPEPQELTVPFCLPTALLWELQHDAIVQGARQQQVGKETLLVTDCFGFLRSAESPFNQL
jgi:hypothetical protein